ncbi:chaperonin 10-like protein [Podospora didyma]|uniref:Chaperonin 10-like protein n=1 Tax=Podospora didyma TaxID=330526 RepID=A0AAE0U6T1_9PEZI|nr:chaperonin 10-like protein [Podospora didyma]
MQGSVWQATQRACKKKKTTKQYSTTEIIDTTATMSRTTPALVVPELNGKFEMGEVYLSEMQPDEVLVEIHATGFCHTDLSCAQGLLPSAPGCVLGHEGAGVVLEAGSEVTNVAVGDKVLMSFSHCETCHSCTTGHPSYCYAFNERNFGGARAAASHSPSSASMLSANGPDGKPLFSSFFGQSSFARHTLVHRSSVVKVGPDTDLALYAPLGCGMQTGAGAVLNSLRVREGSSVAVFGVGSVGMAAVMAAAKISRAEIIIAVDLQQSRLDLAKELGATHRVIGSDKDVVEQIRKISGVNGGIGGVDYAVDCTGVQAVIRTMIDSLGTRGRASTVGAPGFGKEVSIDVMNHLTYGKEYVGCTEGDSNPAEFIPYLMEMQAKGLFPMDRFISYYDMKDYATAIEDTKTGKAIKAVLKW